MKKLFTSESVTEGHPDKLCDYIADSILDAYLEKDPNSFVGCEVVAGKDIIFITGEVRSFAEVNVEEVTRKAILEIGYDDEAIGLDYRTCEVIINLSNQSSDIASGVDHSLFDEKTLGAGDQGMMVGYACEETDYFMPLGIVLAHQLAKQLSIVRKSGLLPYLRPDGKVQVTVEYEGDVVKRIDTIVVSCQHDENISLEQLTTDIQTHVIDTVIDSSMIDRNTSIFINPTGRFVIGGPHADSGLTGRKIMVDTYGGYARHGGGAFSGKDPTKVDRSGAYMARFLAKNIVANGFAKKCEIQLAYVIGLATPVSIFVNTFGTGKISEEEIISLVVSKFDLSVQGIIDYLDLKKPIYRGTVNYGHFGREHFPWERIIRL